MQILTRDQLHKLASRLVDEAGGQAQTARIVGVSQPAISQALADGPESTRRVRALIRIVEALHGGIVEVRYEVTEGDDISPNG